MKTIFFLLCKFLYNIRIYGKFETKKPTIIISNHQSLLDGALLWAILPNKPLFIINTTMTNKKIVKFFIHFCDYITIDQLNPMSLKSVIQTINTSSRPIVIFPEGRVTNTGGLMKIYEGVVFIAQKTDATILPIIINGSKFTHFSRMPKTFPKRIFTQINITYFEPFKIKFDETKTNKQKRYEGAQFLQTKMQNLIFKSRTKRDIFEEFLYAKKMYGCKFKIAQDIKGVYSYKDILTMSLILGKVCVKLTKNEKRIGIIMPNIIATLGLIFGLISKGKTPTMINFTSGVLNMQNAINAANLKFIITSKNFLKTTKLEERIDSLANIKILYIEDFKEHINIFDKIWLILFERNFIHLTYKKQDPNNEAAVLFTSGSEGKPKGVSLSHNAFLANIYQISSVISITNEDKMLNSLPLFHSFGLNAGGFLPILSGTKLFLYVSPLHYKIIPEISYDSNATILIATNTFLGNYAKKAHIYDFHKLKFVICGAEKLSKNVKELWLEKFGIRILEGYGTTETAPIISVNTPLAYKSDSVGKVLPGIEIKLEDIEGIKDGGILCVKCENIMSGYLKDTNPGILEKQNEWYKTGDIVKIDEDGFLHIIGRVKRFAKIAGEMVGLEEIEKLATKISPNFVHAVISIKDEKKGESLILFTNDEKLSRDEILNTAKQNGLSELYIPKKVIYIKQIPLLSTGKTDYVALSNINFY
ncbi:MAG: AMP-binding protein [Campylobacter sputorum]|uniref:AMP-binding protein n=1 Tax=Campylobacter sputorum TaxID=206 RepID=UPI000B772A4F|nr:AMP-binding protein [Campylobacter sputorum]ASM39145.1 acyl-CoA synthetase [Campylobacter sputorum bv. paraureolyticus LMG 11764]MDY6120468.1 AMP-binding protein [Campylobacter sputorum]